MKAFCKKTVMSVLNRKLILAIIVVLALLISSDAKKNGKLKKTSKNMMLRQKETNAINFIRLSVMRLIYGVATRMGFGEQISEALNGAFVPPGVDDYDDYGDGGFLQADDDYDY